MGLTLDPVPPPTWPRRHTRRRFVQAAALGAAALPTGNVLASAWFAAARGSQDAKPGDGATPASAALLGEPRRFAPTLPAADVGEGIAVDPVGNVYLPSALLEGAPAGPEASPSGTPDPFGGLRPRSATAIVVVGPGGEVMDRIPVAAGPTGVVGLAGELFVPGEGLYVVDMAGGFAAGFLHPDGRLLRVDPATHAVAIVTDGFYGPNALARGHGGELYVADGASGRILRVAPDGSARELWTEDPLLGPTPVNALGANGLAFDPERRFLYTTNPGNRQVLRVPVGQDGSAGPVEVFADGAAIDAREGTANALVGADGLQFDVEGNLYVAANWVNEIQVLSPESELVARTTGGGDGRLSSPSSLVFLGTSLFVSNTAFASDPPGVLASVAVLETSAPGLALA